MTDEIRQRFTAEYPELSTHFDGFTHVNPLGVEARRLCLLADVDPEALPFPASNAAILFFSRQRERAILDGLKAARKGRK